MLRRNVMAARRGKRNGHRNMYQKKKENNSVLVFFMGVLGIAFVILMVAISALPEPNQKQEQLRTLSNNKVVDQNVGAERKASTDQEYYTVFSTACSAFQDWQSYVFFYYAKKVNQPGRVVRIASGCSEEKIEHLKKHHKERVHPLSPNFHVHFTPDFAANDGYKYNNKPFGLRHFIENFLGYPNDKKHENAIIIVVDPDQMLLKPITKDFSDEKVIWHKGPAERKGQRKPRTMVDHGSPMAQLYGFGGQPFAKVNITAVAGENSPALKVTDEIGSAYYPAGPPYLATLRDMYKIAYHWTQFMPAVHSEYPYLLGEMFGYCIASAHVGLPHQISESFMVSDPDSSREGWPLLEKYKTENLCRPNAVRTEDLPQVFHYCQRYWLGKWFIGKYRLDVNFISCEAPLLTEPPEDVGIQYDYYIAPGGVPYGVKEKLKPDIVKRHTWSMCFMIAALNEVAIYFKNNHCAPGTANFNKTYVFGPNRTEYKSSLYMWGEKNVDVAK